MKIRTLAFLFSVALGVVAWAQVEAWLRSPVEVRAPDISLTDVYVACPANGEDDATECIQRALDAAGPYGVVRLAPSCVYQMRGTINLVSPATIDGQGAVLRGDAHRGLFSLAPGVMWFEWRNLVIDNSRVLEIIGSDVVSGPYEGGVRPVEEVTRGKAK